MFLNDAGLVAFFSLTSLFAMGYAVWYAGRE